MKRTIQRFFTWSFDDDMAIVDTVRRDLWIVNATAANVWRLLEAGISSREEICQILSEHYGTARTMIDPDIGNCLAVWQAFGWIGDAAAPVLNSVADEVPPFGAVSMPVGEEIPPDHPVITYRYRLLSGRPVTLHLSRDGRSRFHDIAHRLRHLLAGLDLVAPPDMSDSVPDDGLALLDGGDRYWLRADGAWLWTNDIAEITSRVQMQMLASGYADLPRLVTMHAAVVGQASGCLVLPGISGAGKSTLTGWLACHGWSFGGDDITGLMAAPHSPDLLALPFTTALSVKNGAWPILTPCYPDLMDRPLIPVAGRDARYVPLPADRRMRWDETARTVRALVFPNYEPGSDLRLEPLSLRETIELLSKSGFTTGDHLDSDILHRFFTLLDGLPRFRLIYSRLEQAQPLLESLLAGDD